ncbi:hypothetical protein Tco_0743606 [Tanacetum coccineum]
MEKNTENNKVVDKNVIELSELNVLEPEEVVDVKEEVENGTDFVILDVKEDEKCNTPKMGRRGNMSGSVTS